MTFEEWWDKNTYNFLKPSYIAKDVARAGWNAALEAAIHRMEQGGWTWDDRDGFYPSPRPDEFERDPEDELKKLLTE